MSKWLGLDVGGANLKAADGDNFALSLPFPLWKQPDKLARGLAQLITDAPEFDGLALTMTGELADCFLTREEGVLRILEQVTQVVPAPLVQVYSVQGEWLSVGQAARRPWEVAAANWHAVACYGARFAPLACGLVVDIGSTTTDIIPMQQGKVATDARSDSQRLQRRQLVYTGVERTPICAVAFDLPLHGTPCPVMAEVFATMQDAYVWIGEIPEDPNDTATSDNRPRTRPFAAHRLARMVGEDGSTLLQEDIDAIAETAAQCQAESIARAMDLQRHVLGYDHCQFLVTTGHGDFVMDAALNILGWNPARVNLATQIGKEMSRCCSARAVACLATDQLGVNVDG